MDIMRYAKLGPLLPKKLADLTLDDLNQVSDIFGLRVSLTEELKIAALGLLQGKDLNTVSDVVQSPESIQQLMSLFRSNADQIDPGQPDRLVRCPHCRDFFLINS